MSRPRTVRELYRDVRLNVSSSVINFPQLLYLGRSYPKGYAYFRAKCKAAFLSNRDARPDEVPALIARGEFVIREIEALYMLRKYRTLKKRYYSEEGPVAQNPSQVSEESGTSVPK